MDEGSKVNDDAREEERGETSAYSERQHDETNDDILRLRNTREGEEYPKWQAHTKHTALN